MEVVSALSQKFERIIIAVTNPDLANLQAHTASSHRHTDGANPFSYEARVQIIEESIASVRKPDASTVQIEIVPFDLTDPGSWQVPADTVFALRIFSPWEASKLSLFSEQGFATLQLQAPRTKLSASDIRQSLLTSDSTWKSSVVPGAIDTIQTQWDQLTSLNVSA